MTNADRDETSSRPSKPAPRAGDENDPRWQRTRQAILQAGGRLFGLHHADGVSVDNIIREAKVSKQSFYNHFLDKDALVFELLAISRREINEAVSLANSKHDDPADRLVGGMCVCVKYVLRHPHQGEILSRVLLEDTRSSSILNMRLVSDITDGLEQGRLATFTLETGLSFVLGVSQALIRRVMMDPKPDVAIPISQQFTTLVLRAFGLPALEAELVASKAVDRIIRQDRSPRTDVGRSI